jgi:catechol 2,3-dioxygenase-like lactoylglutathione lyase family enzyme
MFSHVVVGSNDLPKAKQFYDAVFTAIGGKPGMDMGSRLVYMHGGANFLVTTPINGEPACFANGGTIGFAMDSPEQADAWHAAGVAAGGTDCESPPADKAMARGEVSPY